MPFASIRGLSMYYERSGQGHPLLFLNGSGGDLRARPGPMQGPLPEHFDVVAHDQRGLGQTDRPDEPYTMGDYAEDAAALLDHLGIGRAHVMGVSFGGMVAQELAVRHPQRVTRLVLACTSPGGEGGASYPLHELAGLPEDERARRGIALADTRFDEAFQRDNPDVFARMLRLSGERAAVGQGEPGREVGARRQMEARRGHDVWDRLPGLPMPVLVCGGRYDGIAPPENLEAIASRVPDATLEFFEGGHLFLVQDPRANERILQFLGAAPVDA